MRVKERVQKTLGAQFGLRWMLWLLFAVTCMISYPICGFTPKVTTASSFTSLGAFTKDAAPAGSMV